MDLGISLIVVINVLNSFIFWTMTTDDAINRVASRVNSTSGYYPNVEELFVAMNNDVDYKALTGKLTKD